MRIVASLASLLGLIFLVACFKAGPAPVQTAVTIELSSSTGTITLGPGSATTITAIVYDQSNQGVNWTIVPLNFGILSAQTSTNQSSSGETTASITYTVPKTFSANTSVTITATSVSNPNVSNALSFKASPFTVSLGLVLPSSGAVVPASAQTFPPGQQVTLIGNVLPQEIGVSSQPVSWTLLPQGAGSLGNQAANSVTYTAPSTVAAPLTATVTATSVSNSSATANIQITVLPSGAAPNVAVVNLNGGPVPTQVYPNAAFTSVTLCNPGTTTCQTVDGVLVDTGSYGLRILQSQIPQLKLPTQVDENGNTLESCYALADGSFLWGPVSLADIYIASEISSSIPIQVIGSTNAVVPDGCANGSATELNTPQLLGANGILGIGPEPTDCTLAGVNYCDGSAQATAPNLYYACPSVGCATSDSPVIIESAVQVTNPVIGFTNQMTGTRDNTGFILQLPSVTGVETSASGTLTFGVGTAQNNLLGNATVFTLDANDNFTTVFSGQTLTKSSIDSGSNALYFPDSLTTCKDKPQFFCPASLTSLSAQMQGATEGQNTVSFSVDNADDVFANNPNSAVLGDLAGPEGTYQSCSKGNASCVFDWGLPFFYGRTVFSHIDACTSSQTSCDPMTGAWWAY